MIFGYSTNAFVKYPLAESLKRIADLGFKGAEIMGDRPHLYPGDYDEGALGEIKKRLDEYGLTPTNLNSFTLFAVGDTYLPSWIEPDPDRREIRIDHTEKCLKIAKFLGCENISIPPGGPLEKGMTRNEAFRLFYQGLDRVIPVAEELGVKILVEPEPDLLMEKTAEFLPFIRDISSKAVGLNFEIGHFDCAGEDPAAAFESLFEWVGHVHIEDIAPTRVHNHLIAGQGAIDFPSVLKAMKGLEYTGHISLELYPYTDHPEAAGKESAAFLRPLFAEAGLDIE